MDDGKLRALLTAVECGSFSKAAAQLGYTQSAMTHLVNKLEAEVGCTLLERDSQGIRLTDAGRHLLPYIQNVVCACDTLLQEAAEQNDPCTRTLRIGCSTEISYASHVRLFLSSFLERYPSMDLRIDVLNAMPRYIIDQYDIVLSPCSYFDLPEGARAVLVRRHGT